MSTDPNDVIEPQKKIWSINQIGVNGTLLFFDQLLVAVGGWIYWLIVVPRTTSSEVGQATAVFSLVALISTLIQLGLEYPLLKRSSTQRSQILGTVLVIELLITLASIPIVFYVINNLSQHSLQGLFRFTWIAIGILILSSLSFVLRFALLGISDVKTILIIDVLGTGIKFVTGYVLVSMGFGAFGMLMAFLLQNLLVTAAIFVVTKSRKFGFRLGSMKYAKEIIKDGLVNTPSKFSRVVIISLSVVLLASFGISSSEIGTFYVALMLSIVATGGLASSMAYMVIPVSSVSKIDLSSGGARIGVSLTAPLVAALIASPTFILSIFGTQYLSAQTTLLVLSIGILPASITMNTISKFNNLNESKKLISIGAVEIFTFLISFFLLVHHFGTLGAAFSTLIAFVSSSVLSLIWSERTSIRYYATSGIAILLGSSCGYITGSILGNNPIVVILISIGVAMMVILVLKNTSPKEIGLLVKGVLRKN
jgi:O-antigen/teichoic acid export membrane protein